MLLQLLVQNDLLHIIAHFYPPVFSQQRYVYDLLTCDWRNQNRTTESIICGPSHPQQVPLLKCTYS